MRKWAFVLAAVVVAEACGAATTSPTQTSATAPTPSTPTAAAAPAATSGPTASSSDRTMTVDGRDRSYLIYVPASLGRSKPSPLVIYLHGSGGTAAASERDTQLSVQAERQRFVVTYPQGFGGSWNNGCCSAAFAEKVDDLGFVQRIIQRTTADLAIDPDRIYIAGFSAGAAMAYRIACEAPESIAAIGAISGGLVTTSCSPRADLSILEIHGTKDVQSPYGGCSPTTTPCGPRGATLPPVEQMMARFRELFGCPTPTIERDGAVTKTTASPCRGGTEVTLIASEGGVHLSPLGSATGGTMASADVPAVLKFFFAHRRPPAR